MNLRELCTNSPRFGEVDYAAFKKEIGAVEIHKLESYFMYLIDNNIKVSNKEVNSIVAYLSGVTDDKPTKLMTYKGGSSPDVDSDFSPSDRERVVDYIKKKYGANKVASIGTYSIMYAKSAIRFAGKALGYTLDQVDAVAKLIPEPIQGENWLIDEAIESVPELKEKDINDPVTTDILKWARKLEGTFSNRSKHAAGIVIADTSIDDIAPMWKDGEQAVIEFDMNESEALGFVKVDLLSLKTLDVIRDTLSLIKERRGVEMTMEDIPISDPRIFKLFASGLLLGIFQFEGRGISQFTAEFKPQSFMDISLISAGYRPGPMEFLMSIQTIKSCKLDESGQLVPPKIQPHAKRFPILKDVLKDTYGFFLYQEQIQKTVQLLADYNDSEADEFRKIVAKKQHEKMAKEKIRFTTKALQKGMTEYQVEQLWSEMESFASYAFNLSHSVSYSFLSAKTAWLKCYYPVEFYAANIVHELNNLDKMNAFIVEATGAPFNINISPPDINESNDLFTVIDRHTIKFGLSGIIGVGATSSYYIDERRKNGPYKSVSDFIIRCDPKSNVMISMIKAGCFDKFAHRSQLLFEYKDLTYVEHLMEFIKYHKTKTWDILPYEGELSPLPAIEEFDVPTMMSLEKEVTKLWLTNHPFNIWQNEIAAELNNKKTAWHNKKNIGFIQAAVYFKNKNGLRLIFHDKDGEEFEYSVFKTEFNKLKTIVDFDNIVGELVVVESKNGWRNPNDRILVDLKIFNPYKPEQSYARKVDIPLSSDGVRFLEHYHTLKNSDPAKFHNLKMKVNLKGSRKSFLGIDKK